MAVMFTLTPLPRPRAMGPVSRVLVCVFELVMPREHQLDPPARVVRLVAQTQVDAARAVNIGLVASTTWAPDPLLTPAVGPPGPSPESPPSPRRAGPAIR